MKELGNFYTPKEVKDSYGDIVPVYQAAFAGEPWFEVSKCADDQAIKRCVGGLSALEIGKVCGLCGNCPIRNAYERDELIERFEALAQSRPTAWYLERNNQGITLASIAWTTDIQTIRDEKYSDNPEIKPWLLAKFGEKPVIWLDEVFADRTKKPSGNLKNFKSMTIGLMNQLKCNTMAFRTINERLVATTKRDFGSQASIFERYSEIPDRRDFVIIDLKEDIL